MYERIECLCHLLIRRVLERVRDVLLVRHERNGRGEQPGVVPQVCDRWSFVGVLLQQCAEEGLQIGGKMRRDFRTGSSASTH